MNVSVSPYSVLWRLASSSPHLTHFIRAVQTRDGRFPLIVASGSGHTDTVTSLLDHGADINKADVSDGRLCGNVGCFIRHESIPVFGSGLGIRSEHGTVYESWYRLFALFIVM